LFQAALFLFLPEGFPFRFGNLLITNAADKKDFLCKITKICKLVQRNTEKKSVKILELCMAQERR
jgi:hypothetical protein